MVWPWRAGGLVEGSCSCHRTSPVLFDAPGTAGSLALGWSWRITFSRNVHGSTGGSGGMVVVGLGGMVTDGSVVGGRVGDVVGDVVVVVGSTTGRRLQPASDPPEQIRWSP